MMGPVDYVVLGFDDNRFDGSIMRELSKAVDDGTIRVLDFVFIMKDRDGTLMETEYVDQSEELKETFGNFEYEQDMPLLTDEDIKKIGLQMIDNTSAAVLVIEHLWAKGLKEAIYSAGGYLIADGRIHPENAEAAVRELQTTK